MTFLLLSRRHPVPHAAGIVINAGPAGESAASGRDYFVARSSPGPHPGPGPGPGAGRSSGANCRQYTLTKSGYMVTIDRLYRARYIRRAVRERGTYRAGSGWECTLVR